MKSLLEIAEILRSRAKKIRVTQHALGQSAGVSRRTLGHVFSGEHDFKVTTLMAVADRLGFELILMPKGAAQAVSGVDGFETRESVVKTRVQVLRERLNTQAKRR
jgi:transcriptional regulator with XRE-family HTH domain